MSTRQVSDAMHYPIKDDGTDGQDGQQERTPLDLDGHQDMLMGPGGDAGRIRITLGRVTRFGQGGFLKGHPGNIHKGRQVHQEGRTDHGDHGIKEGLEDGVHRDQTEIGKFKLHLVQTEDDGHDDGWIPPAEGVQDIVPVREKVRSPDGVQVQVEDEGRTPAAGREGAKDQKRALDRTERVVVLGAWGRAVGTLDPCGVADREEADETKDKEGDGKVEDE